MNLDPSRQLARVVGQLPDLQIIPPYQRLLWTLRAMLLRRASGVTCGQRVRVDSRFYYPAGLRLNLGDGARIKRDVRAGWEPGRVPNAELSIGPGTEVLSETRLDCTGGIQVGERSHIGRRSTIYTHRHVLDRRDTPALDAPIETAPVIIGDDVMLYSEVVVLPGVTIGNGAVVAVRAVVSDDVPPYAIVAGMPARVIRERA